MNYYRLTAVVAAKVSGWVTDPNRCLFSELCRKTRLQHGIGRNAILKILREDYPGFEIENDGLVRID